VDYTEQWLIQVRKGVVELLVLRLLSIRGELHGYAIVKELLSLGPLVAGESTVYPVLKRLEADGMLVSRWVASESGPPRKYYSLSTDGARFLAEAQRQWDSLVQSVARLKEEDSGE
jgi:PadR family transcriptional regulator, regulatory protein PadR